MKLPVYPLITIDPFFTMWSASDNLYDSDVQLWCGIKKRLSGVLTVDGKQYRFMGKSNLPEIQQTNLDVTPYVTTYTFKNDKVELEVKFWTPLLLSDLHLLSTPCSFVDYSIKSVDGDSHMIEIDFGVTKDYSTSNARMQIINANGRAYGSYGDKKQKPLAKSGDNVDAKWGYTYLYGGEIKQGTDDVVFRSVHSSALADRLDFTTIIAYDDILSIEYMGNQYKGLWTEKFADIVEAITYCADNHDSLYEAILAQNKMIIDDSIGFGEEYSQILTAAARQVLAAHKLFRNEDGELLYFSKECNSNGCINTVDVSYPAVPMFLVYQPELVKAMLTGVFAFARMPIWNYEFAPHDIGRYPIANGQVYALKPQLQLLKRKLYKMRGNIYMPQFQMPVEECGNMLIMSYVYYLVTGDKSQLEENYDLLSKWAKFLVGKGVVLDNQLCTDDFAGHSTKNINLAIKGVMGIACFAKISEVLGVADNSFDIAKDYANQLMQFRTNEGHLPFSVGKKDSWSLKYNLVWDILLDFNLFDKSIYDAESKLYLEKLNEYGTPLDYRKDFTKSDWMLWASCLDKDGKNTNIFSSAIVKFLADSEDKKCFTDWFETKEPKQRSFDHRSVQAGLWMPVLKNKLLK